MSTYGFDENKNKQDVPTPSVVAEEIAQAVAPATAHIADSDIHVTASQKSQWSAKVSLDSNNKISSTYINAGAITAQTIEKADINNGETVDIAISYARAYVVIDSGNLHASGIFDKTAGKLYGLQCLGRTIATYGEACKASAGELGGSYYKEAISGNDTSMAYSVSSSGLSFENTSPTNGCDVNVWIYQLA